MNITNCIYIITNFVGISRVKYFKKQWFGLSAHLDMGMLAEITNFDCTYSNVNELQFTSKF